MVPRKKFRFLLKRQKNKRKQWKIKLIIDKNKSKIKIFLRKEVQKNWILNNMIRINRIANLSSVNLILIPFDI
jgi:hypothetical protein